MLYLTAMVEPAAPAPDEFDPFYARYVARVANVTAPVDELVAQRARLLNLLSPLSDEQSLFRYAPGKWSVKELVGHLADAERIFAYRLLRIGRGDATPLPGFEQDPYVEHGNFGQRTLANLGEELEVVRRSTLILYQHLGEDALGRRGTASGHAVTPRALAWIIAGHELHHVEVLKTKYLEGG